jgi:hypothetical protein
LLNLDKKLDERSKMGVFMVYAQYCTLFDSTNFFKITSIIFINVILFLFSLVHKIFLGFHLQNMLGASMDTSPSTLEWALYEFNLHLEIMRKA